MKAMYMRWVRIGLAGASLAGACFAQEAEKPVQADAWRFSVGFGAISQPAFPGSATRRTSALPVISADRGRFFIGGAPGAGAPAGVGAFLVQDGPWRVGIGLGGQLKSPRKASDSPRLAGLEDIHATVQGNLFGSWNGRFAGARTSLLTDLGGKHQGTQVSLDLEGHGRPLPRLGLSAGPGLTWSDRDYTQTFFGIDAGQSAQTGRAAYAARAGVSQIRLGFGANYQLSETWTAGARLTFARLCGDAASSPLIERKAQNSFGLFGVYRF